MLVYRKTVRLYHTDAAGILYYSHIYTMAHDVYEEMLRKIGLSVSYILNESDFLLPFVHSEADYKDTITVGTELEIRLKVERIGKTAYTLCYFFLNKKGVEVAFVKTVSVAVNKKTLQKIPLPDKLRDGLQRVANGEIE
ncbi:acyl-CoA thioesterase [candidate division KSB1 bacterium]|nr:acyl-CoA thioesterase [candidate division KSB1 bacterium]